MCNISFRLPTAHQSIIRAENQSFIVVYDVTSRDSFEIAKGFMRRISDGKSHCLLILVGNKIDDEPQRQIAPGEGRRLAKRHGAIFRETSAKTRTGIDELFITMFSALQRLTMSTIE